MNKEGTENIFQILGNSIKIYFKNFIPFTRAMLFPVLGQIAGIVLIFAPVYFYRQKVLLTMPVEELQQNIFLLLLGLILMVIPGFAVFIKAFWDYMVVMVSLNTMTADVVEKGFFENFKEHNAAVNLRAKDYIVLLFIIMGLWLVLLAAPPVILLLSSITAGGVIAGLLFGLSVLVCAILLALISVYLCLSFQVFAFEQITPVEVIKKSFSMIKGNFWRAVWLGVFLVILTGAIIPGICQTVVASTPLMDYLVIPFDSYYEILIENPLLVKFLSNWQNYDIPKEVAVSSIGMTITAFLLPLGSAGFTLFYRNIKNGFFN